MSLVWLIGGSMVAGLVAGLGIAVVWFWWRLRQERRAALTTIAEIEQIQADRIRIANIGRSVTVRGRDLSDPAPPRHYGGKSGAW